MSSHGEQKNTGVANEKRSEVRQAFIGAIAIGDMVKSTLGPKGAAAALVTGGTSGCWESEDGQVLF